MALSGLKPAVVQTISVKAWQNGVVTAWNDPRTPVNGLVSSGNVLLTQNDTIRPMPSLILYGTQPVGTVLGEIYEYRDTTVVPILNYRTCMQVVSGVAKVYTSKDLGAWTAVSGKTYNTTALAHFVQIGNKVLVMNGTDTLSYYDIATQVIVPYTALTTPTAPTLTTNTGLTGTTFTITYRVSANSTVGESIASAVLSVTVSTDRDLWNASTQSLQIGWPAVAGAAGYDVYMGVGGVGTEFLIASGLTGTTYTDNGSAYQDTTRPYPLVDSTAGPAATRGDVVNSQVFLTGIKNNPYMVVAGGTYPYQLDFSPANGGTTIPVNNGGKEVPVRVRPFRGNGGAPAIVCYCQGTNGRGKRFTLTPDSITVGAQTVNFFDVTEESGLDGTCSPDGILYYNDTNYYPSIDGFKTDGTIPQIQTIISTRRVSNTIQTDIPSLNLEAMSGCASDLDNGRLYWALPVGSSTNNQIWVLDIDRGGAWMKPWNVAAAWLMHYNSNTVAEGGDGQSHFCVLSNNQIFEFSYQQYTVNNGAAFSTSGSSGRLFFAKDERTCAKLLKVVFTFLHPVGTINVNVGGEFQKQPYSFNGSLTTNSEQTITGWSEQPWSNNAWSQVIAVPQQIINVSQDLIIDVNEELRYFEYDWNSTAAGTDYELDNVVAEFVITGNRDI
jgi:hypothetical protein